MELEKLISTAKQKLGETSASDRTIESFFNNPLFRPAEGEEPDDAYWNRTTETMKWYSTNYTGQHNHEMSAARSAWEEEWKKNHHEEQKQEHHEQPINQEAIAKMIADAIAGVKNAEDPRVAALQKQLDEINTAAAERDAKMIVDNIYSTIRSKIMKESNNEADMNILDDAIEYIRLCNQIDKTTTLDAAEKIIKDRYEKQFKRYNPGGEAPYGISSGGGGGETFAQRYLKQKLDLEKQRQESVNAQRARFK